MCRVCLSRSCILSALPAPASGQPDCMHAAGLPAAVVHPPIAVAVPSQQCDVTLSFFQLPVAVKSAMRAQIPSLSRDATWSAREQVQVHRCCCCRHQKLDGSERRIAIQPETWTDERVWLWNDVLLRFSRLPHEQMALVGRPRCSLIVACRGPGWRQRGEHSETRQTLRATDGTACELDLSMSGYSTAVCTARTPSLSLMMP